MLQRAASNAYSWWWASRIRTSQSKWLDGNLEEMDDRVKSILKLLGEEADSFAKRAEMYYKRRPEVINNVEEAYRAYRALAERYDHVSGELHKANHTIATAFPEQVQYAMLEEDDEDDSEHVPKAITPIDPTKIRKSTVEGLMKKRKKDKEKGRRKAKSDTSTIPKGKVRDEINRLQKAILVLQTEKEFIKSSYESGIAKYWEIEKQMAEMQEEVIMLQEESGELGEIFDDDDARALMTATAIKSCEDAIMKLEESRKESEEQMRVESERIRLAIQRLRSIKGEGEMDGEESRNERESPSQSESEIHGLVGDDVVKAEVEVVKQGQQEHLEVIMEKVKHHFELNPETSVEEIAGKIDEIVGKVIDLETTVSSQTAQIGRLSEENGELERNLEELEKEKTGLVSNSEELSRRLRELEEELERVKESEKEVREEGRVFGMGFRDVVRTLSGVRERFDVRESDELAERSGEKESLEETNIEKVEGDERNDDGEVVDVVSEVRGHVEELAKEGNNEGLVISESIGYNDEAETSGEKESLEEMNPNSRVEKEKEKEKGGQVDVKIDDKESEENFSAISQHGLNEKDDSEVVLNEINEGEEIRESELIKEISEEGKDEREIESIKEINEVKEAGNIESIKEINEEKEASETESLKEIAEETKEVKQIESIKEINKEEKEERETEQIKEINKEEKETRQTASSSSKNKQKVSILSEIMESDTPKLHKNNKKTLKRGISLQQGEIEYASLSQRLPNFRGEERETMLSWQELLLDGLEGRDSILLAEYTSILRNYKETKRRLDELESRNQDQFSETASIVRELRKDNALKDEEIRSLKQLLSSLKTNSEAKNVISEIKEEEEENLEREKAARVEKKLKGDIDSILDENFKFMLRFSASLNRIQDFESRFKDLQSEIKTPTEECETQSIDSKTTVSEISDLEIPIPKPESFERKLRILKTEIEVWVEQITMLKQELKSRVSTLNSTQEEISQAVRASSAKDGSRLSVYQGEVLSMQHETDKVEGELNAGLDLASGIRLKIESDLGRIREGFELPKMESGESRWTSFQQHPSKTRVPLRNFLFGPKPKKKSKFFMLLNPIIQKHLKDIKGGLKDIKGGHSGK